MFIRTKKASRNNRVYVQIVESYREEGRMRQRVVRHIGTAKTDIEVLQLKQLGLAIKAEIEQMTLKGKTPIIEGRYAKAFGNLKPVSQHTKLPLIYAEETTRQILGIHDVYGFVYDAIGFSNPFSRPKQRAKSARILRDIVLARIANPVSKRASVEMLHEQFATQLKLDNVYQMMDKIDDLFYERIQKRALAAALNLSGEKLKVLFYDATTLYFESFTEDDLKQNGYSKDMKFNQPQVLLALFVTEKGLPIGYEVFPGSTFEGHTLIPILEKLKERYSIEEIIFVADRGMLNKSNLTYLNKNNFGYIVGSRIKSSNRTIKQAILDWASSFNKDKIADEITHEINISDTERLILSYRKSRAKKDKADRERAIQKLQARLKRSKNPKQLISNYGFQKFIAVTGDASLKIDENKLQSESAWDGITGIITNHPTLTHQAVLKQYCGLWQVEESFRISKHDLRIRPIYHWTPKRIKAHMAIAFIAFTCLRYLEYRISTQYKKLSPEQIKKALLGVQASIIIDKKSNRKYMLPSALSPIAKQIYRVFAIKTPEGVMKIQ